MPHSWKLFALAGVVSQVPVLAVLERGGSRQRLKPTAQQAGSPEASLWLEGGEVHLDELDGGDVLLAHRHTAVHETGDVLAELRPEVPVGAAPPSAPTDELGKAGGEGDMAAGAPGYQYDIPSSCIHMGSYRSAGGGHNPWPHYHGVGRVPPRG